MDRDELMREYRAEADELLDAMNRHLLALEANRADLAPIREMFLAAHTIKGTAAFLGIDPVRELAHAMEDLLDALRSGRRQADGPTADLLFVALDLLRALVQAPEDGAGAESEGERQRVAAALRAMALEDAAPAAPPTTPAPPPDGLPARRALVVEGSPTVRLLHTFVLEDAGYTVEAVADAPAALDRARDTRYDLVVSGVLAPGVDGFALLGQLRHAPSSREAAIILACTDASDPDRDRALALGARAYVRKGSLRESPLREEVQRLARAR